MWYIITMNIKYRNTFTLFETKAIFVNLACSIVPFHVIVIELELFSKTASDGRTPMMEKLRVSLLGSSATTVTLTL